MDRVTNRSPTERQSVYLWPYSLIFEWDTIQEKYQFSAGVIIYTSTIIIFIRYIFKFYNIISKIHLFF